MQLNPGQKAGDKGIQRRLDQNFKKHAQLLHNTQNARKKPAIAKAFAATRYARQNIYPILTAFPTIYQPGQKLMDILMEMANADIALVSYEMK